MSRTTRARTRPSPARLLPALVAVALGLAACSDGDGDVANPAATESPADGDQAESPGTDDESPADEASPTEPTGAESEATAEGDCSAAGLEADASVEGLPEPIADMAAFLLDAAVRCDQQLLVTAATEGGTQLTFGGVAPDEFFALPEEEGVSPAHYEVVARLLAQTSPVLAEDGAWAVWPAAFEEPDVDAHWDELVSSGLYDQQEVDEMRAFSEETESGYLGWRLGINAEGEFQFLVAGD